MHMKQNDNCSRNPLLKKVCQALSAFCVLSPLKPFSIVGFAFHCEVASEHPEARPPPLTSRGYEQLDLNCSRSSPAPSCNDGVGVRVSV